MPAQKYYLKFPRIFGTPPSGLPTAEQSTALPNGTYNTGSPTSGARMFHGLRTTPDPDNADGLGVDLTSLAQTARQSGWYGYLWYELGAGTVASGTWQFRNAYQEGNTAANAYLAISAYVWRPSTSAVVGYVYDASTQLGTEWPTTAAYQTVSFSGSAVTAQAGDVLIVELWHTAAQGMATAYVASAAYGVAEPNGSGIWLESPDILPPPPITGTATAASDGGGVTATGRSNPGGAATAASDGGGATADAKQRNAGTVSAASDGGGATASGTQRNAGTATAASDGGGVTASATLRLTGTSTAASDGGGVTASGSARYVGTATAASDGGGATASGNLRNVATTTAASDGGGATASGTQRNAGTATAASDGGGVLAEGTVVSGTTVSVPSSALSLQAVAASVSTGAATVATPPAALRLLGVAPAVVPSVTLSPSPVVVALGAVPPTIAPEQTVTVPMTTVLDVALAPAATPGLAPVALSPASVFYYSIPPAVQAYQLVPAATLTLGARAPAVSGGGGTGLLVIPRRSGEGMGSLTAQD